MPDGSPDEKRVSTQPKFNLRAAPDRMAFLLDCPAIPEDLPAFIQLLQEELKRSGVPAERLGEQLERRIQVAAANAQSFENLVVVEGERPILPEDGYIEWARDFFATGFVVDPDTGVIDYRKRTAQPSVQKGQLLATLVPANPGQEGRDVFGKPVRAGRGHTPAIRPGSNVHEDKPTLKFYAAANGRVRWSGSVLAVDEVYTCLLYTSDAADE